MKFRKTIVVILTIAMMLSVFGLTAFAADASAKVYVTIVDKTGTVVLAQEAITVTDIDADGSLTINDALYAAHEQKFTGGASAGYATATGDYGLSITTLWGTGNGSGFGYYLNDAAAMGLTDVVSDGDYLTAFIYTDTANFSDTYTFFDVTTVTASAGSEIVLTLSAAGYDANWNPVVNPVEGAVITVGGTATSYTTDANGKATIKIEAEGTYVISATSSSMTMVPPVCIAIVTAETDSTLPDTGSGFNPILIAVIALIAMAGIAVTVIPGKVNEK
ncbi:MAG TPA: hypothetical protein PK629_08895 [Oscillospiraceae bacterium]|nr:hypothetical protein [Oscillospiraceae bacterium]HPF55198.1 hypothetical protein [Clostridiales bacterium]HPK36418.1 hypothetical protein [Oscillospiraceae bacterium]HPR75722.1 hypothetical protein [Oscillospiraceae bacterium]